MLRLQSSCTQKLLVSFDLDDRCFYNNDKSDTSTLSCMYQLCDAWVLKILQHVKGLANVVVRK